MGSINVFLIAAAVVCAICASTSAVLLTRVLDQRGLATPFPLMRLFFFRNVERYKEITRRETGKIGPLFYLYVISINATLVLAVIALVLMVEAR